ncbi:MAG: ATP-dependent metallopeptidase FtsH/Yme1/Tma family protein [Gemmatimonadota bacterium]
MTNRSSRGRPAPPSPPGRRPPQRPRFSSLSKSLLLWALILFVPLLLWMQLFRPKDQQRVEIKYSEFAEQLEQGNLASVTIIEKEIQGELEKGARTVTPNGSRVYTEFRTFIPFEDPALVQRLEDKGVAVEAREPAINWLVQLVSWLPWVLIIALWIFFIRQMQGGGSRAFAFGKSRAKLLSADAPKVTFEDVAGADEAKQELEEIIDFLRDPKKFQRLGGRIPKGVLLLGPPGTGKTLLARAVAGEAGVPFFSMSGSDFVEMFVGVGASVIGDTPVLVRSERGIELLPIGEFVDRYYEGDEEGKVLPVFGIETLGYETRPSGFRGHLDGFGGSAWKGVRGVYRHRVDEIYEVRYLGGSIRTTGDHSVFVRGHGGIKARAVRDLKRGDVLVNLPYKVRNQYDTARGTTHEVRAHAFEAVYSRYLPIDVNQESEALAEAFDFVRANEGITNRNELAQMFDVSSSTIGNWQSGRHEPRGISNRYERTLIPDEVPLDQELLKLFGYYTAEGRANGNLEFCFGAHEHTLIEDCALALESKFGQVPTRLETSDNTIRLIIHSAPLGRFFAHHCGNGSHEKNVPEILWDLPCTDFLAYLEAYSRGDGYTSSEGKLIMTSVSRRLVRGLAWLCAMHGIKAGIRHGHQKSGRIIKRRPLPAGEYWTLVIGRTSNPFLQTRRNREIKKPIVREIVRQPYDGFVYDLCGCENEAFFGGEKPVLLHNSRVRDLFEQGKAHAPCIIFVDEIDAVGRHRGAGLGGGHDEREQTLNQLLVEMDGFESNDGVILIAATNRPDVLDPALLRPGRFDRQVVVDRPDVRGREGIFKVHTRDIPLSPDVDLRTLAKGTPGLAGADIENIVNEAALLAARNNRKSVTMIDFEEAKDKVMMGAERKSMVITDDEKRSIAFHEAGHALVRMLTPAADPVHKVTIIPRGRALGVTHFLPVDERHIYTREWCEDQLTALLGGRAAEVLVLKATTTGAGDDLQRATDLGRRMVTKWGMSEVLGPLTYGDEQEQIFLGREMATHRDYSEETARLIDQEVKGIVADAFDRAVEILSENEDALHRLAESLLEREILDNEEIRQVIAGETLREQEPVEDERERKRSDELAEAPDEASDEEGMVEQDGRVPADSAARASRVSKPATREGGRAAEESPLPSDP